MCPLAQQAQFGRSPKTLGAMAASSSTGQSLLGNVRWIWIGKDEAKFQSFIENEEVVKLNLAIKQIIKHPCPCFPKTMLDNESGQQRIQEVELGDVFPHEVWKRVITQPASVGALHSHRRAWHVAELQSATDWAMFIEDDIKPTANASDRIKKVFEFLEKEDDGVMKQFHMLNFVMGDSPYMKDLAEKYSTSVFKDGRFLEIRTCPMKPPRTEGKMALHVGLGLKWYALSGTARRFLLTQTMDVEAYELFIMGSILTSKVFQITSVHKTQHLPEKRAVFITPTCGEHARDYDDFFIGSGRYKRDSGHEAGPYVMVIIPHNMDLIRRLHMICFGAELARIGRLGLVIHWPTMDKHCTVWFQDMFRWSEDILQTGIAFTRVLHAEGGGTVKYYSFAASEQYRVITLDFEVDYIKGLEALINTASGSFKIQVKSILKTGLMAQHLRLQPWIMKGAYDWLSQHGLEMLKRGHTEIQEDNIWLYTIGDYKDADRHRKKFTTIEHSWNKYVSLTAGCIDTNFLNEQKVVFLTNQFDYLRKGNLFQFRKIFEAYDSSLWVTFPPLESLDEVIDDVVAQQECLGTFMALLQIIKLEMFPTECTYYHSHVLWADIVGSDAKQVVDWLERLPTEQFMPFISFAGKNFAKDMNKTVEPPWKKHRGSVQPDTKLQHWVKSIQPTLSDHNHMNDTIFKYITRAHHMVLKELPEQTVDLVDKTIQDAINENKTHKMAMSAVGNWAKTVKQLEANKTKYKTVSQPSSPRSLWPWLTALILVTVNQYREKIGKRPLTIDSDYVLEVAHWDGNMEAIYESRGPGRTIAAGLVPKFGGCPKR